MQQVQCLKAILTAWPVETVGNSLYYGFHEAYKLVWQPIGHVHVQTTG